MQLQINSRLRYRLGLVCYFSLKVRT